MSNHVEQIKERLSIVDLVSSYMKLEKAGVNYKARCPFHNEKTPSFIVSPTRNTFYCFGCGAKGDIFSFVEQFEGTDFKGALKTLAERAGVGLTPLRKETTDKRARLYAVLEEATLFFEEMLKEQNEVQLYVKKRGITSASVKTWRIGYALAEWRSLLQYLEKRGYTFSEMEDAGLIKRREEKSALGRKPQATDYYDRFRDRVMFPIMDSAGRVVAYSGRILPSANDSPKNDDVAKYINSPETELYEKSRILYGYHQAKQAIRKNDFSILVEGQMDVVLSHQAGFPNTVAASGTALTEHQVLLLSRLSGNIVMAFDADAAGITAGGRGIDMALASGMDVKVAALPEGKDPADLAKEGKNVWRQVVREAKHVVEFYLDHLCEQHTDERKRRVAVGNTVIPYIAQIPDRIDQAHFVTVVASRLSLAEEPIWESVKNATRKETATRSTTTVHALSNQRARHEVIRNRLLSILLVEEKLTTKKRSIDPTLLRAKLEGIMGKPTLKRELETLMKHDDRVLFKAEKLVLESEDIESEVKELLQGFKREEMRARYGTALSDLKRAEEVGDKQAASRALEECRKLGEALNI